MNQDIRESLLEGVAKDIGTLSKAVIRLYEEGHVEEADKLEKSILELTIVNEEMIKKSINEWILCSKNFEKHSETVRAELEGYLNTINKNIKIAAKVSNSIALIDKAIKKLAKTLA